MQLTFVRDATGTYTWLRNRAAVAVRQPASTRTPVAAQARSRALIAAGGLAERLRAAVREDSARWRPGRSPALP